MLFRSVLTLAVRFPGVQTGVQKVVFEPAGGGGQVQSVSAGMLFIVQTSPGTAAEATVLKRRLPRRSNPTSPSPLEASLPAWQRLLAFVMELGG